MGKKKKEKYSQVEERPLRIFQNATRNLSNVGKA